MSNQPGFFRKQALDARVRGPVAPTRLWPRRPVCKVPRRCGGSARDLEQLREREHVCRNRRELADSKPNFAEIGPNQSLPTVGQLGPNVAQNRPTLGEINRHRENITRKSTNFGADLDQFRAEFD